MQMPLVPSRRTSTRPSWKGGVLVAACVVGLAAPASNAAAPLSAMTQLKQSNDRLDKLLKTKRDGDDPAAKQEMKSIVNGLLDYDELARLSLAMHWTEITPAQQKDFVATLRELIEKNYLKQLRSNLDYEVGYLGESTEGATATVKTLVKVRTKGKSTDMPIEYKMKRAGAAGAERWLVFDIITDEVSMVKNYKQQFNRIINTEHFDGLLKKMRNKIADVDKDAGTSSGSAGVAAATATPAPTPAGTTAKAAKKTEPGASKHHRHHH